MDEHLARREEAAEWAHRLHELPFVRLHPLRVPVARLRASAPDWLRERAEARTDPLRRRVWDLLRDPAHVGTPAVAQVPVFLTAVRRGYVLDFLLPEYGVNVQVDRWDDGECDDGEDRDADLRDELGIETVRFWDVWVRENLDLLAGEIRKELGIGRPPWLRRI
jgi:very-short-patch-repair endonuclease